MGQSKNSLPCVSSFYEIAYQITPSLPCITINFSDIISYKHLEKERFLWKLKIQILSEML